MNNPNKISRENQDTHFIFSIFFFPKIVPFIMSKSMAETEDADVNMSARCMLD
jgi:hypothetical protein